MRTLKPFGVLGAALFATLLLAACDKEDLGTWYYIIAGIAGSLITAYWLKKSMAGVKKTFENVALKFNGQVAEYEYAAGSSLTGEIHGAHDGHRFEFRATADKSGTEISLKVFGKPLPPPVKVYIVDKTWWKEAADTFGLDPKSGETWGRLIRVGEPADVMNELLSRPGVQQHLEALGKAVPLSLQILPKGVRYRIRAKDARITKLTFYGKEDVLTWLIEAMVAFTMELERE